MTTTLRGDWYALPPGLRMAAIELPRATNTMLPAVRRRRSTWTWQPSAWTLTIPGELKGPTAATQRGAPPRLQHCITGTSSQPSYSFTIRRAAFQTSLNSHTHREGNWAAGGQTVSPGRPVQ